jgi:kumamolisin
MQTWGDLMDVRPGWRRVRSVIRLAAGIGVVAVLVVTAQTAGTPTDPRTIAGPYALLLSASADLGPSRAHRVQVTAALRNGSRPAALIEWAAHRDLSVRWRPGDQWAVITGAPSGLASAFGLAVHDYRGRLGQLFYASPQQPRVPDPLGGEVEELGRILSFTPFHDARPPMVPLDVPGQGLSPEALLRTYDVEPLAKQGYTGKGVTVVVFAFDGFDQSDLDMFSSDFGLPKFTPDVLGGMPSQRTGEATMDLEAIHAMAPDAKKVLVNARPTVEGGGTYEKIAAMMEDAQRHYPGAVWSLSIGWGCDKLVTAADLVPVRAALRAAHAKGTTAFDASGDLAGLECKGGENWSTPPGPDEIGLDSVASVPEMTDVGGTSLSTDHDGNWVSEQAWFDIPLLQGTGGGVSALFPRPPWQEHLDVGKGENRRLTPDIAAVADPHTGVKIVFGQTVVAAGGTSLAAPLWAGITAVIDQYLAEHGGLPLGDVNPLLYEVAQGARLPGFRHVPMGANAVDRSMATYDLVTGLGTPHVDNLAEDLLAIQKSFIGVG